MGERGKERKEGEKDKGKKVLNFKNETASK
jgi:hypothetical protein